MSRSQHTDNDGPVASRTRRQAEKRTRDDAPDAEKQPAQSSAHVSPAMRLYRHALESIFAMLHLRDLSRALAVSRSWAAAVRSMKPIGANVQQPMLLPSVVCASSLAHHVSSLLWYTPVSPINCDSGDLQRISMRLSKLTALSCQVVLPQPTPLLFSAKLTDVNIGFTCDEAAVPSINEAIITLSRLPLLTKLHLDAPRFYSTISFAALQSLPLDSLDLQVTEPHGAESQLTHSHLDQLRSIAQLHTLSGAKLSAPHLKYLIRAPHQLQLQSIPSVLEVDEGMSAALSTLPTLTNLHAERCDTVSFLFPLVNLRAICSSPLSMMCHPMSSYPRCRIALVWNSCCSSEPRSPPPISARCFLGCHRSESWRFSLVPSCSHSRSSASVPACSTR